MASGKHSDIARDAGDDPLVSDSEDSAIISADHLTVKEIDDGEYGNWDEVLRSYAESSPAQSVKSTGVDDLDYEKEEEGKEPWLKAKRARQRWKRRSTGSVLKRSLSQMIGSDSDDGSLSAFTSRPNQEVTKDHEGRFVCSWAGCTEVVRYFSRKDEWSKV